MRLPVFLARRPDEPADEELHAFYRRLLPAVADEPFHNGAWQLCTIEGWPDNDSCRNLVAWCWRKDDERVLVVVNLAAGPSQGKVLVPWADLSGARWQLAELLDERTFIRDGNEMLAPWLYVDLPAWGFHLLNCSRA